MSKSFKEILEKVKALPKNVLAEIEVIAEI